MYRFTLGLLLVMLNISCDQLSKKEVRENIASHEKVQVVNDNFILTKVENTGAALSFGASFPPIVKTLIFQILPLLILIYMFYYLMQKKEISRLSFVAISFIIGGGIGNIIDRVLYNSVTDFMYMEVGPLHTGIFNMADVSVTVGAIALVFNALVPEKFLKKQSVQS
ncbi:signal peptidase II [Gramella sp. AN32]|nr:signal peptidase II [Gramella sp. AN32]